MIIRFKHFHDNLRIVLLILAPGCKCFSTKCDEFPLTFAERN